MAEYRRGAHTVFEIHLHLVWITKYRRLALHGEVATRVRDKTAHHLLAEFPHLKKQFWGGTCGLAGTSAVVLVT
jgi:REP element-mobilizing transposase RayT